MTVGVLCGCNLPSQVLDSQFGYHKQLAEEYLDVNLLTNQNIQANLVNGVLDEWIITFQSDSFKSFVQLDLRKNGQSIKLVDSDSSRLKAKLCNLAGFAWNNCDTIYQFVLIIAYILSNRKSVYEQRKSLSKAIMDLKNIV